MSAADKLAPYAHLLGTVPDRVIAEQAGISRTTVSELRRQRNIPAFRQPRSAPAPAEKAKKAAQPNQKTVLAPPQHPPSLVPEAAAQAAQPKRTGPKTTNSRPKSNKTSGRPAQKPGRTPPTTPSPTRLAMVNVTPTVADSSPKTARVACCDGNADKTTLLARALEQAGFWRCIAAALAAAAVEPEGFSILITPDFACFDHGSSTGTDPALVEGLIDLLQEQGYANVAVGASPGSADQWLENRDVVVVADMIGYRFITDAGHSYDIVDLSEDIVDVPFPPGSVLHGTGLARPWVEAHFRINFPKNKTHEEFFYALGLHNLLGVLPLDNKHYHYRVRLKPWDVCLAVLQQTPPQFTIIDAVISNHGSIGAQVPHPLETQTVIAGQNLLLTDWVGAVKMGLDPHASLINAKALAVLGLPEPHEVLGNLAPYEHWDNVHPLWAAMVQRVNDSPALSQVMNLGKLPVNRELFPFKGEGGDRLNGLLSPLFSRVDQNPAAFWAALGLHSSGAATLQGMDIWRTLFVKDQLRWQEVPLDLDLAAFERSDYEAVVDYIESLETLIQTIPADHHGLRWRYLEGSVLFKFSRVIDAPFDSFGQRVDISRSIQFMKDYIGGCCVPIARDEAGRVTHQAERNLYLPQPNYLVLYGGKSIDVAKLEFIRYGADSQKIFWRTVKSSNGSAEYDDGSVTFSPVGQCQTLVTIVARQKFTLPLFWQAVNLDLNPPVKNALVSDAYYTYFSDTLNNFEAQYEGRPFRIGQPWAGASTEAEPGEASPESRLTDLAAKALHQADRWASRLTKGDWRQRVWPRSGPKATVDADGFSHFEPEPKAQAQAPPRRQAAEALKSFGVIAGEFLGDLGQAVRKDLGLDNHHD